MKRKGPRQRGIHLFAGRTRNTTLTVCGKFGRESRHHLKTTRLRNKITCRACKAEMKQRLGR